MMKNYAVLFVFALTLVGCAPYRMVPDDYSGPRVWISDTAVSESRGKGRFFVVESIDGNSVYNAIKASSNASRGTGFVLHTIGFSRTVLVQPMKLVLAASHLTGAPIHAIFSMISGNFKSVSGEVDFLPEVGKDYVVTGELSNEQTAVWIEEKDTHQIVTKKIISK